jgi:hypothetical protein
MHKLDDRSWPAGADGFPVDVPEEDATRIGMFVAWAIHKGLWAEDADLEEGLGRVRKRKMTGVVFFDGIFIRKVCFRGFDRGSTGLCRGVLWKKYLEDYSIAIPGELCEVEDSWDLYDLIAPAIDEQWAARRL